MPWFTCISAALMLCFGVMSMIRNPTVKLALLLALLLPLHGFAAASGCAAGGAVTAGAQHCPHETGAAPLHSCGTCCVAAVTVMPALWLPPRPTNSELSSPVLDHPPLVALDRLDRPPRFIP
jgi:hypothetical protein